MHKHILFIAVFCLLSCSSIPRPDLGKKKNAGKTYVAQQRTVLGKPIGGPYWTIQPTKADALIKMVQAPAKYLLWLVMPIAIIATASMAFMTSNPVLMKRIGIIAGTCGVASVICIAVLMATMWLLALIPIVIVSLILIYRTTKHKKLKLSV